MKFTKKLLLRSVEFENAIKGQNFWEKKYNQIKVFSKFLDFKRLFSIDFFFKMTTKKPSKCPNMQK